MADEGRGMHGPARSGALFPWDEIELLPSYRIESHMPAPGEYVIALEGELDLAARSDVDRELERIEHQRPHRLVADLSGVTFIDIATLGLFESAQNRLRAKRAELRIVCADRHTLKVLRLTGLDRILDVFETRAEALRSPSYPSNVIWLHQAAG